MKKQSAKRINVIGQYRCNILQVLWLTCMTERELEAMIMEAGVLWLMTYTGENDEEFVRLALEIDELRSFWVHEWCKRDNHRFLAALYSMPDHVRKARYKGLHEQILFNPANPDYDKFCESIAAVLGVSADKIKGDTCN